MLLLLVIIPLSLSSLILDQINERGKLFIHDSQLIPQLVILLIQCLQLLILIMHRHYLLPILLYSCHLPLHLLDLCLYLGQRVLLCILFEEYLWSVLGCQH